MKTQLIVSTLIFIKIYFTGYLPQARIQVSYLKQSSNMYIHKPKKVISKIAISQRRKVISLKFSILFRVKGKKLVFIIPINYLTISRLLLFCPLQPCQIMKGRSWKLHLEAVLKIKLLKWLGINVWNHLLRRWNENKSSSHPKTSSLSPTKHVALNIWFIELK